MVGSGTVSQVDKTNVYRQRKRNVKSKVISIIIGLTASVWRLFQKYLEDISCRHVHVELQGRAILGDVFDEEIKMHLTSHVFSRNLLRCEP
jgi:hypothetical protein